MSDKEQNKEVQTEAEHLENNQTENKQPETEQIQSEILQTVNVQTNAESKNRKKRKLIIAGIGLAAVIAAGIIYNRMQPKEVTNYDTAFEEDQTKPENEKQKAGTEKGIQIPGYKTITVAAGSKDVDVELMNPEENEVYFEISFYLPDTDETIYTSKKIKPGQHIYHITLNRELQAGEYPLTVKYATCSADEKMTPKNGAEVNCTLKVV